jgi:hypothetical protein
MANTYMLRTCDKDMRAYNGFVWPESGPVSAPDWNPEPVCGGGLHGLLMGIGDISHLSRDSNAKWFVVAVDSGSVVDLDGKVKVPSGNVVYCGDRDGAVSFLVQNGGDVTKIPFTHQRCGDYSTLTGGNGSTLTGGDYSTLTGGNRSTLTGGNDSTLTGGNRSTLTGGNRSTLTGGYDSTLTGGYDSTLTGGYDSTLTGGDDSTLAGGNRSTLIGGNGSTLTGGNDSTLTGGNRSTLTGGHRSTLTGGNDSTLTGGNWSTLTGGDCSTLTGGNDSTLIAKYWDEKQSRYRFVIGEVRDGGLRAGVTYRCVDGRFVKA